MDRAREFYSRILGRPVELMPGTTDVALIMPLGSGSLSDVSGDLVVGDRVPSATHGANRIGIQDPA
jgi:hydrogenase maturation factor HypE